MGTYNCGSDQVVIVLQLAYDPYSTIEPFYQSVENPADYGISKTDRVATTSVEKLVSVNIVISIVGPRIHGVNSFPAPIWATAATNRGSS